MTINNLPAAVQQIVQDGWLLRFFNDALFPALLYRRLYEGFETPLHLGQTFTFTKKGLLPPVQDALTPASNTDFTSGLTPQQVGYEQYAVTMSQYAGTVPTNMLSSSISIVDLYKSAAQDLGLQAGQSLDIQARRRLSQAYRGGRTYLTAAATASTSIAVNDVNGFDFVYVNGVRTATSVTNPHPVTVDESGTPAVRNVTAVTPGSLNTDQDNIPGTLTLSAAVTSVIGDAVISDYAPFSIRPGGGSTSYDLTGSDIMTYNTLVSATSKLRSMAIPTHDDGFYHAILHPEQVAELFRDTAFQRIYDTHADSEEFQRGMVGVAGGVKIFESQLTPSGANPGISGSVEVKRAFVTGKELGYEAQYAAIARWLDSTGASATGSVVYSPQAKVAMILRTPLDVLQQVLFNSWSFIGDWVMATDTLSTIGNSSAYYKRAVLVETA